MTLYPLSKGLNLAQVASLVVIQSLAQLIFEIPSGAIADFFGRKNTLIIAGVFRAVYMAVILFGFGYGAFLIGWMFYGIAEAFESGSDAAFVYDTLKECGRENDYQKVEGRGFSFTILGWGAGAFFGGFIIPHSYDLAVLLNIVAVLISCIINFTFKEPKRESKTASKNYISHMKIATSFVFKHKQLLWLTLLLGGMTGAMQLSHLFFQPYMLEAGLDIKYFGLIYVFFLGTTSLVSAYSHRVERFLGSKLSVVIIPTLLGLSLVLNGLLVNFVGIAFIFLNQFVFGFTRPVVLNVINKLVTSEKRATVISISGFLNGVIALFGPVFGYFGDLYSIEIALLLEGIVVLIMGTFFAIMIL
ncbi:MFS transporter, partial [bacterium]|nr:MFS transporter [bacterium]